MNKFKSKSVVSDSIMSAYLIIFWQIGDLYFRVKGNMRMGKIFKAYEKRMGVEPHTYKYSLSSIPISII
jgi:hypothetical protein